MNRLPKAIRRVFVAAFAAAVGVFLFGASAAYHEQQQAEKLLRVLQQIRVGSTDRATALEMTRLFRSPTTEFIHEGLPGIEFHFDNRQLARLKVVPYTDFRASLLFKDGVVAEKHATEFVASGSSVNVTETKRGTGFSDGKEPSEYPNHIVSRSWNSSTSARRIAIRDDDTYGEASRRKDWNFNLTCLTRFGGCQDARLLLPGVEPTPFEGEAPGKGN